MEPQWGGSFQTMDTMVGVLCPGRTLHHGLELREGGKAMMWGPMGCAEVLGFIPRERHGLGGFKQKRDTVHLRSQRDPSVLM